MTDMAVEGASVVLTASGGWMWLSGKDLKIKVKRGSNRFAVDSKGILLWEHIERAVTQRVAGKPYRHKTAVTVPGAIGKIMIRAKKPSFSNVLFCDGKPVVTIEARGEFDVIVAAPSSILIPGTKPDVDTARKHSGTWKIEE